MSIRRALLVLTCSATLLTTTGCSSGSPVPKPSTSKFPIESLQVANARFARLTPLFVQCLAQHNIPLSNPDGITAQVTPQGVKGGWYKDERVINNIAFQDWVSGVGETTPLGPLYSSVQGQSIQLQAITGNSSYPLLAGSQVGQFDWWVAEAAVNGKWPAVCGTLPKV
jgi:hypothetical protein